MIIHNEDFYYSFDMRNSSNSGRMNYCDSLRITRYGSEFESDFEDKGMKESLEVRQIFILLDQIQLILDTILPFLEPIVGRIQPCGSGVTNVKDLVELYNLIESTQIKALCNELSEISSKVIDSQQFKDSINQNLQQRS